MTDVHPERPPAPRRPLHRRRIAFDGFLREDGLWDIEGELTDTRCYDFLTREQLPHPAGRPIHRMRVRVTVDDSLTVVDIEARLLDRPYESCAGAEQPVRALIGASIARGWRKSIDQALGGVAGCTHVRELLFGVGTAAYQTLYPYKSLAHADNPQPRELSDGPPAYLDTCITWERSGPTVQRHFPMFHLPRSSK